jgi:hypothetical protein
LRALGVMSGLWLYVSLASASPMIAASIPTLISRTRRSLPGWIPFTLLAMSAGMLFAVATLDLIPEGIEIASAQAKEEWNPNILADADALFEGELSQGEHSHEKVGWDQRATQTWLLTTPGGDLRQDSHIWHLLGLYNDDGHRADHVTLRSGSFALSWS